MAALDVTLPHEPEAKLSAVRCGLTGAVVLAILFAVCWAAAAAGFINGSHMYVALFTIAPVASSAALVAGLCWSIVFGALTGCLIAITYNALAFVTRR
jgi:hypothetical protein